MRFLLVVLIILLGLYLRFFNIEKTFPYGFDQARDSWVVRDILLGKWPLGGPRTGVGDFKLGPLYLYMLAPFYWLYNLDPIASEVFNIFANLFNFFAIFYVIKKIFSFKWAIFALLIYVVSAYHVRLDMVPWNVSPLPGVLFLVFYSLYYSSLGKYKFLILFNILEGILFHLHFTAIVLLPMGLLTVLISQEKIRALKFYILSLPLFLIFLIPNLIYDSSNYHTTYYRVANFLKDYLIGFHFRFMLHRLPDVLIQFEPFLIFGKFLKYVLPLIFAVLILVNRKKADIKLLVICSTWLFSTLFIFTVYGGPISDYYFLITLPAVFIILIYVTREISKKVPLTILAFIIYWTFFVVSNLQVTVVKNESPRSLENLKKEVRAQMNAGQKIKYDEWNMNSYLYVVMTEDKKLLK